MGATRLALDQAHAQQQELKEQRQRLQQQPRKRPRQPPPEVADAEAAPHALEPAQQALASRAPPELATPTEPQIARLLSRCRESLGTSHAPTFAATRAAVEVMATPPPKKRGRRAGKQQPAAGSARLLLLLRRRRRAHR